MAEKILFKDGKIQFSSGTMQFVPNGGVADDCVCCNGCSNDGANCTNCTDTNELTYTCTFSGVTLCGCFTDSVSGVDYAVSWASGDVLNATHTLTQLAGSPCTWQKELPSSVDIVQYASSDASCTTAGNTDTLTLAINLIRRGSTWVLYVSAEDSINTIGVAAFFFDERGESSAGNCSTIPALANDSSASGSCGSVVADAILGGPPYVAYGGTATVVC